MMVASATLPNSVSALPTAAAPATIAVDNSEVEMLTRSVEALKISLAASEEKNRNTTIYMEDMKAQLELALSESQTELEKAREFYTGEAERISKLLATSYANADKYHDELMQLKSHFQSSKVYSDWKKSKSAEAFASLPMPIKIAADAAKNLTDEELSILMQVKPFWASSCTS